MFLAGGTAVVVAACADRESDGSAATTTTTGTSGATTTTTSTTGATTTTSSTVPAVELPADPFTLGVASGDPDATSVVLWTRLAPDPLNGGGMPDDDIPVTWEVSQSADFAISTSGVVNAAAARGHSVHATVPLDQGTWYYRFRVGRYISAVGVTKPAPVGGTAVTEARFAAASCQHYAGGHYAAHRDIAENRPDFVVWLGDYIYEDAGAVGGADIGARVHLGAEPTTLEEYRNRYARYKTDPQLQSAHAACPWFIVWDDHEVENNYAGLTPQDPADTPTFQERRFAAYQAWWEHQPVRLDPPASADQEYRVYRDMQWGDLIELALLDGRQYRTDQACGDVTLSPDPPCPETSDPARTMLGDDQETWLFDTLGASTAVWNVIGNQVVFADSTFNGAVLNYDQWDGYPLQRERILRRLGEAAVPNVVVLTGDIHLAAVAQLRAGDSGVGSPVGVEFVTTSISSAGLIGDELTDVLKTFPDLVDAELAHRGYALHTVTPERWTAEYRIVADVSRDDSEVTTFGIYAVAVGSNTVAKVL
jgi:alkaline phosphatase D